MRRHVLRIVLVLAALTGSRANAQTPDQLIHLMLEANGGAQRINEVRSIEYETVGYFHGRHQSRHIQPPWDRIPIRQYIAVDFDAGTSVRDILSAWPGGLTMGYRDINDGDRQISLNTIARLAEPGGMGHSAALNSVNIRFPALFVRLMADNPDRLSNVRQEVRDGMNVILAQYGERTTLVIHAETHLLLAMEYSGTDHMAGREVAYRREYQDYMDTDGIMVPQRFLFWVDGLTYYDMSLPHVAFNTDITPYLEIPDGFAEIESSMGYSGQPEISVREIADGVYAAGNGETQILYVEFDDYWLAMETGGFPAYAENTHEAMRPFMNGKPLRYIVPTHYHDDHLIGVHYYARIGATILTTRDKEPYIRELLNRSWGDHGPVENAQFDYIDGPVRSFADDTNRFDVLVYADAPHTENMLVGYVHNAGVLFSGDIVIGWIQPEPGVVRQGAPFGARHLDAWIRELQADDLIGPVNEYTSVHGLAYSPDEWRQLLETERTYIALPNNRPLRLDDWFLDYGLIDDTVHNARRDFLPSVPTTH